MLGEGVDWVICDKVTYLGMGGALLGSTHLNHLIGMLVLLYIRYFQKWVWPNPCMQLRYDTTPGACSVAMTLVLTCSYRLLILLLSVVTSACH